MTSTLSCPPRWGTRRRPERPTIGGAIAATAAKLGKPLMPWQRHVADVIGEYDPVTKRFFYSEVGLTVPRQSGKSTFVLAVAVHRSSHTSFFGPRQRMVYTAQTRAKAREKWEEDYLGDLELPRNRQFGALANKTTGNEHIRFPNGSKFGIDANTEKAGHGGTIDLAFIDEAFAQADNRLEGAFRPAMITRKNKQLFWISTAGWLGGSPYLEEKVPLGRLAAEADSGSGLAYFEWSAREDQDPADPATWWGCMPALGHTITEQDIANEHKLLKANDFARPYLNLWVPKDAPDEAVIDAELWLSHIDPRSSAATLGGFGLDVQPGDLSASIVVAGRRDDGNAHVEVIRNDPGTDWIVAEATELWDLWRVPVVVDPTSPAGAYIADLEAAGVQVQKASTSEYAAACQSFVNEVKGGRVKHQGWPQLAAAIGAAQQRDIGDGGWGWARKKVTADISPLVAATLAMHGLAHPERVRSGSFNSF